MPAATPPLSLAAADRFECVDRTPKRLLAVRLEPRRDISILESGNADDAGDIGHAIVRQFGCTRYTVEIELPLPATPGGIAGPAMIETILIIPSDHFSLWSVAESLRLSASEPFVYGTAMEFSEEESVSLRFDAKGSSVRLMLVYKVGL